MNENWRDRYEFEKLAAKANAAGKAAVEAVEPQMMCVKNGATGTVYGPFPVCGFAWVVVKPNRGKFAKYLKDHEDFSPHYGGGISKWMRMNTQSMDIKAAYAGAYAGVLSEAGYDAYADSRMD